MVKHIVTTDDDPAIRKVLQLMLKKEGYDVTTCKDGSELEEVLNSQGDEIDLILLDIKMPGLSGFELLEIIRHGYPHIPIVMLTAFNDLDTGMKEIRSGASDYLAKPVRRDELIACVQRVISKSELQQNLTEEKKQYLAYQKELEEKLSQTMHTLKDTTRATLEAFSETIEQKDAYTKGHCNRVRDICVSIGRALNLSEDAIQILEGGAILHDIGKIGIPEQILNKESSLDSEEEQLIRMHPVFGERIIIHINQFQPYRTIIRSHHERFDGKGYPDGLKGKNIPLEARIVALADSFDAMTTDRAYRAALPVEIAVEEIKLCSGAQFDPELVDIFLDNEIYLL